MVPNGWELRELKDLTAIYDGTHSTPKYVDYGVPFYSVEHLTKGDFSITKFISEEVFEKENRRVKLERNDILMTRIGDIGTAVHLDWNVRASFYVSLALLKASVYFDSSFMTQYINSSEFHRELWKRIIHVAFPKKINLGEIGKCHVLLPPLPEQRKIAKILSTWDKAISTTERLIDNSKQQKKALMQQLLTGAHTQRKRLLDDSGKPFEGEWETAMLSDIGKVSIGLVTTMTKYYVDDGIPLIRNSDIKPNTINKTKMLQLCSDFSSDYENRKLRKGDIVTVHTGEVGVSSVIDDELDGCIGFATLNTRPNTSKVNSEYLSWYFNSERFINWCVSMSTGDGRQNLNLKDFVKAKVLLPSLEEQQKIVSVLKNADKEIDVLVQQLADLKQEKKALMQQLLTGKRRVELDDKEVA